MRQTFKLKWELLTAGGKIPFEKKALDHLVKQDIMQECISDALRKEQGRGTVYAPFRARGWVAFMHG
jgi:hypothetical protein